MAFSFNLCATAFVDYIFANRATGVQDKASPKLIATREIASWERHRGKQINVTFLRNHVDMLARYHRRVVEQCYERVYCSVKDGLVWTGSSVDSTW